MPILNKLPYWSFEHWSKQEWCSPQWHQGKSEVIHTMFKASVNALTSLPLSLSQCGPGARPGACVWGPQPAGTEPQTGQDQGERLRHPVQSDNRGPGQRLPARHRQDRGRVHRKMTRLWSHVCDSSSLEKVCKLRWFAKYLRKIYFE